MPTPSTPPPIPSCSLPCPKPPNSTRSPASGEVYEALHVHSVYQEIASHFSSTRYKPWPLVRAFLLSLAPYSIGLDLGCGNGKNLLIGPSLFTIGSDYSSNLVDIAAKACEAIQEEQQDGGGVVARGDVIVGDAFAVPHPRGRFDFAISIAVVHHLSTGERRVGALRGLVGCLRVGGWREMGKNEEKEDMEKEERQEMGTRWTGGRGLVYVWALEQPGSRRGWDVGRLKGDRDQVMEGEGDVIVPWVMKGKHGGGPEQRGGRKREKRDQMRGSRNGGCPGEVHDGSKEDGKREDGGGDGAGHTEVVKTFGRYYHLYRDGELASDVIKAGGVVLDSGYEKDNWWAVVGNPKSPKQHSPVI